MQLKLPFEPILLVKTLIQAGYEAHLVGGAVRDLLLQSLQYQTEAPTLVTDYDLTTNATPEQIRALFPESYYENQFGTVSITHEAWLTQLQTAGYTLPSETMQTALKVRKVKPENRIIDLVSATKIHASLKPTVMADDAADSTAPHAVVHPFEITTYRSEGLYGDHRRPDTVSWGTTLTEDLTRRDFTVNAIALDLSADFLAQLQPPIVLNSIFTLTEADFKIVDPHQGMKDLAAQVIRAVGDPNQRFQEDALRMLRAIRLSVQLHFDLPPEILDSIAQNAQLLQHVSFERIRDEFLKMLSSSDPKRAILLLTDTYLLEQFLPEVLEGYGVQQSGHHTTDVLTHSLDALAACPSSDPIVRLATLLHDVAKPATAQTTPEGVTFYNHEIIGSRMAVKIGRRLRLSNHEIDRLFILVRHHMFHYQPENTDASVRRFMRKVGLENIDDILDLREADRLGSNARKTSWRLEEFKQRMIEQLHQPLDVTDLAINGHDLMEALQLKPGPILGKLLHELFEAVMEKPELNTKAALLEKAKQLIPQLS